MKKFIIAALAAIALSGCGEAVSVDPGEVGKILTKNGYKDGVIQTSKFRLDPCAAYCDQLVTLDVSTRTVTEKMKIFMPKDRLNLDIVLKVSMAPAVSGYEELFMIPAEDGKNKKSIPWNRAYMSYVQPTLQAETRQYLSQFTISEIQSSLEAVNAELGAKLKKSVNSKTPFVATYVGLIDVDPPASIVNAAQLAAKRKEDILAEEIQLEVSQAQLQRQLQEAQLQRKIDVEKAEAEKEINAIVADSMTPQYVSYRQLQILEKLADSENKTFVPSEFLSGLGGQVALGNQLSRN